MGNAVAGIKNSFLRYSVGDTTIEDDGSIDIAVLHQRYDAATEAYAKATKNDVELRSNHLETLIQSLSSRQDSESQEELKSLRALLRTERQTRTFAKLRNVFALFDRVPYPE